MILRLDDALVEREHYPSRSRAKDAVLRGTILVNGIAAKKPAQNVQNTDLITIADVAAHYVSRAALKLLHGLAHFKLSPQDKFCFDIGASTGGFTQVLLERGANHVISLDVGHDQLHPLLRDDLRVTCIEGQNARDLSAVRFSQAPEFLVTDVSFISLKIALPQALALAAEGAEIIALIKPQFEVGREGLGKGGIVRDVALLNIVCDDIGRFFESSCWTSLGIIPSPIEGGDGNREFLIAAKKN